MTDRQPLIEELGRRLTSDRLVTLTGPPGCGKSWVALTAAPELGRGCADGVQVLELHDLPDPALLRTAVAGALGVELPAAQLRTASLADVVDERDMLLVLDGCELLLEPCAELVTELLRRCARLRVLTTSRQPLRVTGERVLAVPPLSVPQDPSLMDDQVDPLVLSRYDAVALFVARASAASPGFRLTEANAGAVAAVCARLEGNPLAIQLAAARTSVLAPQAILERLEDRYRLLSKGAEQAPARQQSLRAAVEASYQLCTDPERILWSRMSVFPANFDLDAVEAVCSGDGIDVLEVLDLVDSLLEKSVLVREDADASRARYRLLETLRRYGAEQLGQDAQRLWRQRLLGWCTTQVRTGAVEWFGPGQATWFGWYHRERATLRAALELATADPLTAPQGLRIAAGLEPFWLVTGRISEGRQWLTRALRHGTGTPPERLRALTLAAWLATLQDDCERAEELLAEARTLQGSAGVSGRAAVARAEGAIATWRGRYDEADASFQAAAQLALVEGSSPATAMAWFLQGLNRVAAGRVEAAEDPLRRCLARCEQAEETQLRSSVLGTLAVVAWESGELTTASAMAREALSAKARVEESFAIGFLLELLASTAMADGDAPRAVTLLGAARRLWRTLGVTPDAVPPLARGRDERLAAAGEAASSPTLQREYQGGMAMPTHLAIQYALDNALPDQRRPLSSTPLTARELEVAELVARGMSNPEIATALVISVRTAQGHVENILRKLRFTSRSQVAAWVAEKRAREFSGPAGLSGSVVRDVRRA